jgi:hypothetical protein
VYTAPGVDLGESRENALPHTLTERRRRPLECGCLTEQDAIGTHADLVGPGISGIRQSEKNREAGANRQSLSVHDDIPRHEDVISRGRTLSRRM